MGERTTNGRNCMSQQLRDSDPDLVSTDDVVTSVAEDLGVTKEAALTALRDVAHVLLRMPGQEQVDILCELEKGIT